jgi:hypothetical protein
MTSRTFLVAGLTLACLAAASPALAQAPQPGARAQEAMKSCRDDYARFCSGVQPGGGRILACLQNHASELSPACGKTLGN